MPTLVRAVQDERDCLLAFLAEQRATLRRGRARPDRRAGQGQAAGERCHADIVRESLDGATAFELVAASGTPFFT